MAKPLTYNATLTERIDLTDALAIFKITPDVPPATHPWLIPGQYCVIGLNNEENPELGSVRRAMSIVSAPEETGPTEFYIRYVSRPESENPLTHLLWATKPGDRMYMRPVAAGKFTIEHTIGADDPRIRVLVAAGTGAAPFVSMVRSRVLRDASADLSRYVILHGASYPADLGYRDQLTRLAESNRLRYFGTVSRPKEVPDWRGHTGRVEDFFMPERLRELEQRIGLPAGGFTPRNVVVYVCGLQGTVGISITHLLAHGFIPDHRRMRAAFGAPADVPAALFFEQYDTTLPVDIKNPAVVEPLRALLSKALASDGNAATGAST